MKGFLCSLIFFAMATTITAQNNSTYWQQKVHYKMEIDMDVDAFQYKGKQELVYTNNSPDTLTRVFYHLYFNAFQPGSEMDVRSRNIADPDRRVGDRISKLSPLEIGYIKPSLLTQNGQALKYEIVGTVMEVALNEAILPGQSTKFNLEWDAQIPVQIRRSGRNNKEGVALSMAQWYPKLAEYDFQGWHADPYIGREFHGVWGDFDVSITINSDYTIGGTGYLQNPDEIGHGYSLPGQKTMKPKKGKYTWRFTAPNVHDFTWAADKDYIHDVIKGPDNVDLHFFYKNDPKIKENWKNLQPKTAQLMQFYNDHIGPYPYKQYSVIQGGDGGMEYGMCTLMLGGGSFEGLVGLTAHELAHSWFQFVLASNESKHAWMDEGFSDYIEGEALNEILNRNSPSPHLGSYRAYYNIVNSGNEEPQSTHSDRFKSNRAYGRASYTKGAIFLSQLEYVIGTDNLSKTLKRYFKEWKFKHPTPNDFIRVAEKVSGFELDWYLMDWTQTTKTIDYGITAITYEGSKATVNLERIGLMPMPIDLFVLYEDGSQDLFYIPLQMARAEKPNEFPNFNRVVLNDWSWAHPTYSFDISNGKKIKGMMIDASMRMADIFAENNSYPTPSEN